MKSTTAFTVVLLSAWLLTSCASRKPYYQDPSAAPSVHDTSQAEDARYSLFLAGGLPLDEHAPVMRAIHDATGTENAGLVMLGDVLHVDDFSDKEADVIRSLDKRYRHLFVIPGQQEWSAGRKTSPLAIRALDAQCKDIKDKGRLIQPAKGCGTPEVVRLEDHTILVLVDSQWAIDAVAHPAEKQPGCELANILEWRQAIKDIIQSHPTDHIIIATHHPVYANGPTAGNYPLSSHLLPLPVAGTLITGIKTITGSSQHFGHPAYEAYRSAIITAISGCHHCVVISGHEKSLQYFHRSDQPYLVAGSGKEFSHARKGERAGFSYMSLGYVRADALSNGHLRVSMVAVREGGDAETVWKMEMPPPRSTPHSTSELAHEISHASGDSIWTQASMLYEKKKFLRGHFYRKAWSQPVRIPVLWLEEAHGGLRPVQLGGGNQTRSLRLENEAGEQYVIRSIDKKVTQVLPVALRGTLAENIVQDGIAASHPYGALVVPKLAEAAGVFYTHPSIVYVPHQPALGIYDQEVGNGVYMLEERPGGNTSGFKHFGNTEETVSTADLLDRIADSPRHVVDQKSALRARLFDIWLGDWDRHDDQWRWAAFREGEQTVYRPIPRDRDQVFFNNDGVLDYVASRPYFNPPLRRFDDKIDHLEGLVWAGKYFDRSFLHQLSEADFIAVARDLQHRLTDTVIEEAFLDWPRAIDQWDGERIRRSLRIRRDDLADYARAYYRHLAREVSIACTDDPDIIRFHAPDDDHLEVTIYRKTKQGLSHLFFQRTFDDHDTRELRVYGLNKPDTFHLTGTGRPAIRIRMVGGTGKDQIHNQAENLKLLAYDKPGDIMITGNAVRGKINHQPFNNTYDRTDWNLNRMIHFPAPAYYTDEGFGLSYNLWAIRHGFRSDPHKSRHVAGLSYFFNTGSFIGRYSGEWLHSVGTWDLGLDAFVTGPTFTQYFYGLGNTYVDFNQKPEYHIVKGSQVILSPSLRKTFGFGSAVSFTPSYQWINIEDSHEKPRFIYSPESGLTQDDFGGRQYIGATAAYRFERFDNAGFPTRGAELEVSVGGRASLDKTGIRHTLLSGGGSLFIPFDVTGTIVLATHIQADKLYGDYEFFHALTLGGRDKLRGFRMDRFAGDARFIHATDLRLRLFKSQGIIPFGFGIYGSIDYGRIWYDGDEGNADTTWHTAYGGGIFIVPLGLAAFRLGYMVGEKDTQVNIGGALKF